MTEHERKLIRAVRILLNWARKHEETMPPFPTFHAYMSDATSARLPQWRAVSVTPTRVTVDPHSDGEEALIATAETLVKEDKELDPDAQRDPSEVAVWLIDIPNWGSTLYVATEAQAEEWRRDKARSERSAGSTKRRLTSATPQALRRYKYTGPHHAE